MQELRGSVFSRSNRVLKRYFKAAPSLPPLSLFLILFLLLAAAFASSLWLNTTKNFGAEYPRNETFGRISDIQQDKPRNETSTARISEIDQDRPRNETTDARMSDIHRDKPRNHDATARIPEIRPDHPKRIEIPVDCTTGFINSNQTSELIKCPNNYPRKFTASEDPAESRGSCPDFFKFIHEDLKPWRETGITRDMVEGAKGTAHFRLVIKDGTLFVEKYKKSIQTRDVFTIWGILQLLRRYPGRLPDLELMFDCDDRPVIRPESYRGANGTKMGLPPLFRYCGDRWTADIVFPDWSFWGWAEINIKPWHMILEEIKEGNKRVRWMEREPFAYWKGNPFVAEKRQDLLRCNLSDQHDWSARLFIQDWILEGKQGFQHSGLADQCTYRYKIYIEGYAWSVSEKYILACDSVTLMVDPYFYDFFTRYLQPLQHYWPVRDNDKCKSIKFAVDWGNHHKQKAQEIGRAASNFMQEDLNMDNVYDYMFHLLKEYAKLLRFKPEVPPGAREACSESMVCPRDGRERRFMMDSLVKGPSISAPCDLNPPPDPKDLQGLYRKKLSAIRRVHRWEDGFWQRSNSSH